MTQDLRDGDRATRTFFRSATFTSFFFGPRHVRVIAWGGAILLGIIAFVNAFAAFYLASLIHTVGDMCQRHASIAEVKSYIIPFAAVYFLMWGIEPMSELIRNYYTVFWAKVSSSWFSDTWIMDYKRTFFGNAPEGLSQIIVDRPLLIAHNLVNLYVPLWRSIVIMGAFGYMTYTLSDGLSPFLSGYLKGWLLYLVVGWSCMEAYFSYRFGRPLPVMLDVSYKLRAHFRSDIEKNETQMATVSSLSLAERTKQRDEARTHLDSWLDAYLKTFRPNLKLLTWKSGNQQSWQYVLIAVLPLMVAADFFTLGTAGAAVYAINEMRGALLTLPNQWLVVVDIQAQALGLQELEDSLIPPIDQSARRGVLVPAE